MNTIIFSEGSDTIRQLPQNYLLAHREHGRWIADPDLAADPELATRVFRALLNYDNRYQTSGDHLVQRILATK